MKPPKTIRNEFNEVEMRKYGERRRFESYRSKAHFYFDKIWREAKLIPRNDAYTWLANRMNITRAEVHFSKMNSKRCEEAIEICQQLLNDNRRLDLDFGVEPITPFYIL